MKRLIGDFILFSPFFQYCSQEKEKKKVEKKALCQKYFLLTEWVNPSILCAEIGELYLAVMDVAAYTGLSQQPSCRSTWRFGNLSFLQLN